jgi:hypothetical protein
VAAQGAWLAAVQALGGDFAVARERGDGHLLQEAEAPRAAVAAVPAAPAAAAGADRVGLKADRVAPLEDFGVGEAGVRHLRLDDVGAVEALARPRAARDRLVVLVPLVAEGDVVHRA